MSQPISNWLYSLICSGQIFLNGNICLLSYSFCSVETATPVLFLLIFLSAHVKGRNALRLLAPYNGPVEGTEQVLRYASTNQVLTLSNLTSQHVRIT